jgi:hypothetical protein
MAQSFSLPLLDHVRIASPCDARWEDMTGDERTRRCAQCALDVHNIAAMTRAEAEALIARHLGPGGDGSRLCAQIYRRADGTILTRDCPVGLAAVRVKARRALARVAGAIAAVIAGGVAVVGADRIADHANAGGWIARARLRAAEPFASVRAALIAPPPPLMGQMAPLRGDVAFVPPPSAGTSK